MARKEKIKIVHIIAALNVGGADEYDGNNEKYYENLGSFRNIFTFHKISHTFLNSQTVQQLIKYFAVKKIMMKRVLQ